MIGWAGLLKVRTDCRSRSRSCWAVSRGSEGVGRLCTDRCCATLPGTIAGLCAFQGPDEAGLSDWVRANSECRDLLLVRFGADFPAFVEAGIVGVAQGRAVEGR